MIPDSPLTPDLTTVPRAKPTGAANLIGQNRAELGEYLKSIGIADKQI